MTPDPSLAPVAVWFSGVDGAGLDWIKAIAVVLIVGLGFTTFTLALVASFLMRR